MYINNIPLSVCIILYIHTHIDTHNMQMQINMLSSAPRCCPAVGTEVRHLRQRERRQVNAPGGNLQPKAIQGPKGSKSQLQLQQAAGLVFSDVYQRLSKSMPLGKEPFHNMIHNHLPTRCGHEEAYPFRSSPTLRLRFSLPTCNCLGNDLGCCCYKMRLSRRMPLEAMG
jgi:hypothetical protein